MTGFVLEAAMCPAPLTWKRSSEVLVLEEILNIGPVVEAVPTTTSCVPYWSFTTSAFGEVEATTNVPCIVEVAPLPRIVEVEVLPTNNSAEVPP